MNVHESKPSDKLNGLQTSDIPTIRLLPENVSSKIAAGEVVERPASVVKELVENSLDAGATEITVEIDAGGCERISVVDNGRGIRKDDVELAFQRFATSKVAEASDLSEISTLGFRGEALPSIAAVSTVSLITKIRDEELGIRLIVTDGEILDSQLYGAPDGTTVAVNNLFQNFPARRKFLRAVATELSRVRSFIVRYALAYPEVKFRLVADGSESVTTIGSGDLREAIVSIYGLDVGQAMLEISYDSENIDSEKINVTGMVSPPSIHRSSRNFTSIFVNRRWVQSRSLLYALEQSYKGFLMERRFPVAAVNVNLPLTDVDVNVHPAKTEVRFRQENQVFAALQQTVRRSITEHSPIPEVNLLDSTRSFHSGNAVSSRFWPIETFPKHTQEYEMSYPDGREGSQNHTSTPFRKALPALRILGQVQTKYVIAEGPDGVYLIDQHAAHERVMFEKIREKLASLSLEAQSLLEPVTVDLSLDQRELFVAQQKLFFDIGFQVEPFGGLIYLIRAVPVLLSNKDPAQIFIDVLASMEEGGSFDSWNERAAHSIACHSAIRAGQSLSDKEMTELTRQLEECLEPNTCPHGRPTITHISLLQMDRGFGRR